MSKLDSSGNLYIVDLENSRVLEFNTPARFEHRPSS